VDGVPKLIARVVVSFGFNLVGRGMGVLDGELLTEVEVGTGSVYVAATVASDGVGRHV
jgi:hypothetical protein